MIAYQILVVIRRHFPNLIEDLSLIEDTRKTPTYLIQEIYMACISMFLFKKGSRNATNNLCCKANFTDNYTRLFGLKYPHMDTVNLVLQKIEPSKIESVKQKMIQALLNKKVLQKFRLEGYYPVAIDGTGIGSYDYEPWPGCPYKEYKSGKKVWLVPILEAKLVFVNGLTLSIATEWILNEQKFDKQDCEQKAFKRLAEKLKDNFPHLPVLILADGLYPNSSTFKICRDNNWNFAITLKDGNLKTLWEDIEWEVRIAKNNEIQHIQLNKPEHKIKQKYRFVNNLQYSHFQLNWFECVEIETHHTKITETRFAYVTDVLVTDENIRQLCDHARLRWNIENDGFDTQKHHGYHLMHKYSRKNLNARQNYYQCLQIAHIINQLVEKAKTFKSQFDGKETLVSLWESLIAFMMLMEVEPGEVEKINQSRCQIRY